MIVTGAGRGLGRAHALAFAAEGAKVVVNDLGVGLDGAPGAGSPAGRVVDEIRRAGGEAVAHHGDIATDEGAASLVTTALETYGRLDALVNNAGFLRDRMLVNLGEDDWDTVVRVHLKGHFLPLRHAAAHWRAEAKAGRTPIARVVNTSSGAGLLGAVGQGNYSAAKAGVLALTLVAAETRAVRRAGQRHRARRAHPDDRAHVRPDDGPPGSGFDAMAPRTSRPWSSGSAAPRVPGSPAGSSRSRAGGSPSWRVATGSERRRGSAPAPAEAGRTARELLKDAEVPRPVYGAGQRIREARS